MAPIYQTRHHGCRVTEFLWHGHRLVVLENEVLRIGVLASKGADIIEFRYKPLDLDVLWHAPQSILPAGWGVPTSSRAQGAFLDYFPGGWQEILPNAGPATIYRGAELGQHGEVALLPWDVRVVEDTENHIEIEFVVESQRTPFRLCRRMSLDSTKSRLLMRETLTNLGEEMVHYAWGHHPALGPPFLEAGCRLMFPDCDVVQPSYSTPLKRRFAVEQPGRYPYLSSLTGASQRVDEIQSKESRTEDVLVFSGYSQGRCSVTNPRLSLAFQLEWDPKVFPYFWCWQVYGGSWGYPYYGRIYTLALEPFNCPLLPLDEAVARNLAAALPAGATVTTEIAARIAIVRAS